MATKDVATLLYARSPKLREAFDHPLFLRTTAGMQPSALVIARG